MFKKYYKLFFEIKQRVEFNKMMMKKNPSEFEILDYYKNWDLLRELQVKVRELDRFDRGWNSFERLWAILLVKLNI